MSVHKTKEGTWEVRYTDDAKKQRARRFKKKGEADDFDREVKDKKYHGERVNPAQANMPFGTFYRDKFLPHKHVLDATKRVYESRWTKVDPKDNDVSHLSRFAKRRLASVNDLEFANEWLAEMRNGEISEARMFGSMSLLINIITLAVKLKYLPRCEIPGMTADVGYEPQDTGAPWLPDTIERIREHILDRADNPPSHAPRDPADRRLYIWRRRRDATVISVCSYQPFRIGECMALQWPMILDESGKSISRWMKVTARIPQVESDPENRTKSRSRKRQGTARSKGRNMELCEPTRRDLRWWWMVCGQPTEGYVFPTEPGGPRYIRGSISGFERHLWRNPIKALGLDSRPPKHMRMSAVSMLILDGKLRDSEIAHQAGHSVVTMETDYNRAYELRRDRNVPFDLVTEIEKARVKPVHRRRITSSSS